MGKFTYLNADEIISHVEKFGSDDERDLVAKLTGHDNCDDCPRFREMDERMAKAFRCIQDATDNLTQAEGQLE